MKTINSLKKLLIPTLFLLSPFSLLLSPVHANECEIWDVTATPTECEEGTFFVWIDFEYVNVSNAFKVQGNGNNYGNFEYEDLPVLIGPLEGDGVTIYEFVVIDLEYEGCSDWTAIDPVNCEGGGECEIGELIIDDHPCEEGFFEVYLDFDYANTSAYFHAYANDIYFGAFEYSDLPLDLGPLEGDGETIYNFHIIDGEDPACNRWKSFGPIDCEGGGECFIGELVIDFIECDEQGYYWVAMTFEYENVSEEGFKFFLNDEFFGAYGYEELPIEVGPLAGDGVTQYDFFVRDKVYEGCNNWRWVGPEECENWGGGGECNIWDVVAVPQPCDGMLFNVLLDFEYENVGDNGFKVKGNGITYGVFEYADLPVTVGPLEGDGSTVYEFLAKDLTYEGCSDWTEIDPVDCGELGINGPETGIRIKLFPNPVKEELKIDLINLNQECFDLFVYDAFGREVKSIMNIKHPGLILNTGGFLPGAYFVRVVLNDGDFVVQRFVKE